MSRLLEYHKWGVLNFKTGRWSVTTKNYAWHTQLRVRKEISVFAMNYDLRAIIACYYVNNNLRGHGVINFKIIIRRMSKTMKDKVNKFL